MAKLVFNPDYAKSVTEKQFIDHFSKFSHVNIDLKAKYAELTGKQSVKPIEKIVDKTEDVQK